MLGLICISLKVPVLLENLKIQYYRMPCNFYLQGAIATGSCAQCRLGVGDMFLKKRVNLVIRLILEVPSPFSAFNTLSHMKHSLKYFGASFHSMFRSAVIQAQSAEGILRGQREVP